MAEGPVVLAILDRVSKDADGRLTVLVGLAGGEACSLRISEAAARLLILELAGAMVSLPARGLPVVTDAMKRAGAETTATEMIYRAAFVYFDRPSPLTSRPGWRRRSACNSCAQRSP